MPPVVDAGVYGLRPAADRSLLNYLWQAVHRAVVDGGLYREIDRGISRGCPLGSVPCTYADWISD